MHRYRQEYDHLLACCYQLCLFHNSLPHGLFCGFVMCSFFIAFFYCCHNCFPCDETLCDELRRSLHEGYLHSCFQGCHATLETAAKETIVFVAKQENSCHFFHDCRPSQTIRWDIYDIDKTDRGFLFMCFIGFEFEINFQDVLRYVTWSPSLLQHC